jgi:hypothetical protein
MQSGKQRRAEIKAARQRRTEKQALVQRESSQRDARVRVQSGRFPAVDASSLAPNVSYGTPDFVLRGYYLDVAFTCVDCGKACVWTAERQKWWYEKARGDIWSKATRCAECRAKKRAQRELGRKTYFEGMARKAAMRQG